MQKRARYLLIAAAAAAVAALALNAPQPTPAEPPRRAPVAQQERAQLPAALPERSAIGNARGDVFAAHSWAPPPLAPAPQAATSPIPPPMPYKFAGNLTGDGVVQYFLAKGDVVFPVKVGDTLDGAYRVEAVAMEEITLVYIPLGARTRLSPASAPGNVGLGAQGPAPAANAVPSARLPVASQVPDSSPPAANPSAPPPVASQAVDAARTTASGTRAAHLRRERMQQLPPILPQPSNQ